MPNAAFVHEPTKGFQAAVTVNVNRTLGFVIDFGGLWGDFTHTLQDPSGPFLVPFSGGVGTVTFTTFQLFSGPRFSKHMRGVTVFVHALPGFASQRRTERRETFSSDTTMTSTSNGFAVALGGGVDVNLGEHLAIRGVQIDYLPTRLGGGWENSLRFGFGVVWQFGGL